MFAICFMGLACVLYAFGDEFNPDPEALSQPTQTSKAHYDLGLALKNREQEKAIAEFQQAIRLHPTYTEAH